jgi:predicted nucleic acid-binding protein
MAALDASVLINFLRLERLDILVAIGDIDFVVPEQVVEEITVPQQAQPLDAAIRAGRLRSDRSTDPEELANFADLRQFMGRGEAACLSMAEQRGWLVAVDERGRFLRMARERIGEDRILNTPGILLLAIRADLLSVNEADLLKERLETYRYRMKFDSFRDVLNR